MRQATELRDQVLTWRGLEKQVVDALDLLELAEAESDEGILAEIEGEEGQVAERLGKLEFQLILGGPYDQRSAIVAVHAGMRVAALAVVTDRCLPDALEPASVEAIIQVARAAEPTLTTLMTRLIEKL